jgi:hypothetical protein
MRRTVLASLLSALLLMACQMPAPGGGAFGPSVTGPTATGPTSTGLTADAIAVTPLAAPGVAPIIPSSIAAPSLPAPTPPAQSEARSETQPQAETPALAALAEPETPPPAPAEPEAPKTAAQVLCEKSKGQWVAAGDSGAFYCASLTRDGGKQCRRQTQCQGQCLARSGTCSPITPLYGCNDVLDMDARMVTLCID